MAGELGEVQVERITTGPKVIVLGAMPLMCPIALSYRFGWFNNLPTLLRQK
jgi:hypothetical protein